MFNFAKSCSHDLIPIYRGRHSSRYQHLAVHKHVFILQLRLQKLNKYQLFARICSTNKFGLLKSDSFELAKVNMRLNASVISYQQLIFRLSLTCYVEIKWKLGWNIALLSIDWEVNHFHFVSTPIKRVFTPISRSKPHRQRKFYWNVFVSATLRFGRDPPP